MLFYPANVGKCNDKNMTLRHLAERQNSLKLMRQLLVQTFLTNLCIYY
jgi:hypothetical protein